MAPGVKLSIAPRYAGGWGPGGKWRQNILQTLYQIIFVTIYSILLYWPYCNGLISVGFDYSIVFDYKEVYNEEKGEIIKVWGKEGMIGLLRS